MAKKAKPVRPRKPRTSARPRAAVAASSPLVLVNMTPNSLSGETEQDSEPMLSVDPNDPRRIVGTAFTPDPMGGGLAPYYVSTDRGLTWTLNAVVAGGDTTGDITVAFSGTGDRLYAGILRRDSPDPNQTRMAILRGDDFAAPTPMTVLEDRQRPDQPFTQAATVADGPDAGRERVYTGSNDFAAGPRSATLDVALNAGAAGASVSQVRIEHRSTGSAGQDGPQVRPTIHRDGTVYAVFYGWRSTTGSWPGNTLKVTADVVVVRDDAWGAGPSAFQALSDPADGVVGRRVATGTRFSFDRSGKSANGQQRLGGSLSICVDPRANQSGTVYLVWGADDSAGNFTLHVRRSDDRGATWSTADLLTVGRATNGSVAVTSAGIVGVLYQRLSGSGATARWGTHLRRSADGGATWSDLVLADTPAMRPVKTFDPYLGDYAHLLAAGADFYGIFSANNVPDESNFPNGVRYQRNHDFATKTLLGLDGVTPVDASIDPFFFRLPGAAVIG